MVREKVSLKCLHPSGGSMNYSIYLDSDRATTLFFLLERIMGVAKRLDVK